MTAGARRRWLRPGRIAAALLAVYACYFAWSCAGIVAQSGRDEAQPADAIVVFGAAEYFGTAFAGVSRAAGPCLRSL